jgi:hypothetical protein
MPSPHAGILFFLPVSTRIAFPFSVFQIIGFWLSQLAQTAGISIDCPQP